MNSAFDNHVVGTDDTGIINIFAESTNQNYLLAPPHIHGCVK